MPDAFRRGLGYAVQWYDNLRSHLSKRVDAVIVAADTLVEEFNHRETPETSLSEGPPGLTRGECARILIERCPACFGGIWFGRPLDQ